MHDRKGDAVGQQTGGEPGLHRAQEVQWAAKPHAAGGTGMQDLLPRWVKAGQLSGPRVRSPFSPFPQQGQGLGLRRQGPRLEDEGGLGVIG